jgi:hypothetical protein
MATLLGNAGVPNVFLFILSLPSRKNRMYIVGVEQISLGCIHAIRAPATETVAPCPSVVWAVLWSKGQRFADRFAANESVSISVAVPTVESNRLAPVRFRNVRFGACSSCSECPNSLLRHVRTFVTPTFRQWRPRTECFRTEAFALARLTGTIISSSFNETRFFHSDLRDYAARKWRFS